MVRITKLTDYALVIMVHMVSDQTRLFQAREIAKETHIAPPTVSKLLKLLAKHKFLSSERGALGGYRLALPAKEISLHALIEAIEGPFALTECNLGHQYCPTESGCSLRTPWITINRVITKVLASITLADLLKMSPKSLEVSLEVSKGDVLEAHLETHLLGTRLGEIHGT